MGSEAIGFILMLLFWSGVGSLIFDHLGEYEMKSICEFPWRVIRWIILLPFEIIYFIGHICFQIYQWRKKKMEQEEKA